MGLCVVLRRPMGGALIALAALLLLLLLAGGPLPARGQEEEEKGSSDFQRRAIENPALRHAPGGDEGGGSDCRGWVATTDTGSHKTYYFDRETRVSVWELPPECEGLVPDPPPAGSLVEPRRDTSSPRPWKHGGGEGDGGGGGGGDWQEVLDGSSGRNYYWNKDTGETTWDQPARYIPLEHAEGKASAGDGVWKSAVDPKTMRPYYWNTGTMQVQWERPDDFNVSDA